MTNTMDSLNNKNKMRCGMVLMKYDHTQTFICDNCHKEKTSKKIAFKDVDPNIKICNACYGEIIAKTEKK